jgi:hypothetical protein
MQGCGQRIIPASSSPAVCGQTPSPFGGGLDVGIRAEWFGARRLENGERREDGWMDGAQQRRCRRLSRGSTTFLSAFPIQSWVGVALGFPRGGLIERRREAEEKSSNEGHY